MARTKKVNPKVTAKATISVEIFEALKNAGFEVNDDHESFGFTAGTLVVAHPTCDVQVKLITPKAKVTRYEVLEDEEADDVIAEEDEILEDAAE